MGDSNTKYFHNAFKKRSNSGHIDRVHDKQSVVHDGDSVPMAFVKHYHNFIGCVGHVFPLVALGLFSNKLLSDKADFMVKEVTKDELRAAMFSIGDGKSMEPGGYPDAFFKRS